jgi:peptide/nickel transport system permease protein
LGGFIVARASQAILTLWLVSVVVFFSARLTGSPEYVMMSPDARPEDIAAFRQAYGLDRPLPEQYARWLARVLQGDLGRGIYFAVPVADLVADRLRNSIPLALVATLMAATVAVPLAVFASTRRGTVWDKAATALAVGGQAIPSFWLAMLLVLVFAVNLRLLPATGADTLAHYIMPSFAIGYFIAAGAMRLVRSNMLDALDADYVRFARANGLPERVVVWKHALRNALIPVITYVAYMFGAIIAASITVETVFNWPGIGSLVYQAILHRDFPIVQGVVLIWSAIMIFVNMSLDVVYSILDPRVRIRE